MPESILKEGDNVWKVGRAREAAFLIDAAAYYESLYRNLARAESSVFILGWDIDSRLQLVPGGDVDPAARAGLAAYLNALVMRRPELHVYLLLWDFSSIYMLDREAFQSIKLGLATHPRIHFVFDDGHPVWGSHHHKLVVIDDELAYCGGIDLTGSRWDTSSHEPGNPLRQNSAGRHYPPFHDCQMAVTGEPAKWLGELCRERWQLATHQVIPPPAPASGQGEFDLGERPLTGARLGIARTVPAFRDTAEVREVERLFADMLAAARRYIYIENQYFTSQLVCKKLCESLARPDGPEIVVVLPKIQDSLLAKLTMGTLSMRCLQNAIDADVHGRFHVFFPEDERLTGKSYINVHAKVLIVDDLYARIGSANINNRSMGLDTECDLVIDATDEKATSERVHEFLCSLLADHTGSEAAAAATALAQHGSIWAAISSLNGSSPKSLMKFTPERCSSLQELIAEVDLIDLDQAHPVERVVDDFVFGAREPTSVNLPRRVPVGLFLSFAFCLTVASLLALMPLFGDFRAFTVALIDQTPSWQLASSVAVLSAFVIGGVAFIPLNLLVVAAASVLPTWSAFLYIMGGSLLGALAGYGLGYAVGAPALRRYFPRQEAVVRAIVAKRDLASVLLVRFFPLAPFTLVNLIAGALRVKIGPYLLGTFLGMLPGAVGLVFFQKSLLNLLTEPSLGAFVLFIMVTLLITRSFSFLSRRFGRLADKSRYA